jgi:hypothetical protein
MHNEAWFVLELFLRRAIVRAATDPRQRDGFRTQPIATPRLRPKGVPARIDR